MSQTETFVDLPLEEVIGDRFGRYSKYIIQERALPDIRDGLKPVQRRILFAMHEDKNTHENNFRKAAKTVGTVIGNYHPHGDSSVYEAMVRLSQNWKVRNELIEMHGNNGSIDGDPPAAMRYTEARLSSISTELLRDLDKDTVDFISNFDDTAEEPFVFPARFPNLLVNGSTGISAGYATDIPPHNLAEVIDAVIMMIDKPSVTVDQLMTAIKGPDFPTGGIVQGIDGIKQAYETGKGRIMVRAKTKVEKMRGNREKIVIDEIPYDVNKANMVRKIDELNMERKVEGIAEVRDETDRSGLRIVIELKKDADSKGILQYLFKNTDLQVSYNFNMVAIQDKTPKLLSLKEMLEAYIAHQKNVVTRQTRFDLNKAKTREHIVEGLIKAISILDELIQTIRSSKNKSDAKSRIIEQYQFTEEQAEAIVMLQLYRLTNTDITALESEAKELRDEISKHEDILSSEKQLFQSIKKDLRQIKKKYADGRRTLVEDEIEELNINIEVMIASEDVLVSVTRSGYIKRTSLRSYSASNGEGFPSRDEDYLVRLIEVSTTDKLLLFTSKGRYICLPIHVLPDIRWKDIGHHLSNLSTIESDETIISAIPVREFPEDNYLIFFTKNGIIKRSKLELYNSGRYTRPLIALNLKADDEVINVCQTNGQMSVLIGSNTGYGLWYDETEVSVVGQRARGVIAIQLKEDEYVTNAYSMPETVDRKMSLAIVTQRGAGKRMRFNEFTKTSRAQRGRLMIRELKGKPHRVRGFFPIRENDTIHFRTQNDNVHNLFPLELPISDRSSNGSFIIDEDNEGPVLTVWKDVHYEKPFEQESSV